MTSFPTPTYELVETILEEELDDELEPEEELDDELEPEEDEEVE